MAHIRKSILLRFIFYIGGFVLIVIGLASTTVMAFRAADQSTIEVAQKWLEGTTLLGKIEYNISGFRIAEIYGAGAPDRQSRLAFEAVANERRKSVDALENQYMLLLDNSYPRQDMMAFQTAWTSYQAAHDAWAKADNVGLTDNRVYISGNLEQHYHAADAAIDRLIDVHREEARARVDAVHRLARRMIFIAMEISGAAICLAVWLVYRLRKEVIQPLIAITGTISMLAAGAREVQVPKVNRRDEISEIAAACEVFRINVLALDQAHEETRVAEEQANALARHDALTGLPNRRVFISDLQTALDNAHNGSATCSVLLLDLDNFKKINDLQGHQMGDMVLCEVARRLEMIMRKNDTVARLGGDEFAIIAEGDSRLYDHLDGAKRLAGRVLGTIRQSMNFGDSKIEIGASLGIAICRAETTDIGSLLRAADIAMYRAKQGGRGTFRFFEQRMDDEMRDREALENDVARAIADDSIRPHYQPLVNISQNRIRGFEALARWEHPTRGFVPPDVFIPIVEQLGLMSDLTVAILRHACRDASQWPDDISVAVNVSPSELKDPLLTNRILKILAQAGLAPTRLEVEITETALVSDMASAKEILQALQGIGVKICLDDFGTGYSSLYHLRELKFDKIKIDRSFVHAMQENKDNEKIIDAILGLTKSLNLPTVAEGIENPEVLRQLAFKGCAYGQGYYFGKAMTVDAAVELLKKGIDQGGQLKFGQVIKGEFRP